MMTEILQEYLVQKNPEQYFMVGSVWYYDIWDDEFTVIKINQSKDEVMVRFNLVGDEVYYSLRITLKNIRERFITYVSDS